MLERAERISVPDNLNQEAFYQPVLISPRKDLDQPFEFQPFNPSTISQEEFSNLPGKIQEFALKYLIKIGDVDALSKLRADMQWEREPSRYEVDITRGIDKITKRTESIVGSNSGDYLYAYIKTYVTYSEPELARKLEAERIRRQDRPDDLFYSWEPIGGYDPAVRYRILLEDKVVKELEEERTAREREAEEAIRRNEFDLEKERIDRQRVASIRPDLTSIKGGLVEDVA